MHPTREPGIRRELRCQGRTRSGPGSPAGSEIDWLTIADREQGVVDDVRRIREHPLVPPRIPIYGYVYNVETGNLEEVAAATAAGRPA